MLSLFYKFDDFKKTTNAQVLLRKQLEGRGFIVTEADLLIPDKIAYYIFDKHVDFDNPSSKMPEIKEVGQIYVNPANHTIEVSTADIMKPGPDNRAQRVRAVARKELALYGIEYAGR